MSMSPQDEPDPGAPDRQHERQHGWSRKAKIAIAASAVAATIGMAVVASIVGALWGQKAATPADESSDGADRVGLIGLAPEGEKSSLPKRGELVLNFEFGHTMGDPGRFHVLVYADGRLIWQRLGDFAGADEYAKDYSTGWLEQRLTPEGVELVRAEAISTGLFDHDLHLQSGQGLYFGSIDFRTEDRLVHVTWGDSGGPYSAREMPTPEQERALVRLDARLADPASWLPASAWADSEITAYVPPAYSVCLEGKKGLGLSRVLALLPPRAEDLLRHQENTPGTYTNLIGTFVVWCSHLTNDEARALERILDDAGVRGTKDTFGLAYGVPDIAYAGATEFSLLFNPILPHETEPVVPEVDYVLDLNTGAMRPLPRAIIRSAAKLGQYAASPDGSLLAYVGDDNDGTPQIFVAGIDGSGIRQVTHDPVRAASPAWSPDGTRIAYTGHGSGDVQNLFVLDLATGESTQITDGTRDLWGAQFTPDGSSLLYTAGPNCCPVLRTVPVAGGKSALLIGPSEGLTDAGNGAMSPDGSLVTFLGGGFPIRGGGHCGPCRLLANADGTDRRVIPGYEANPAGTWSPDGSRIVDLSCRGIENAENCAPPSSITVVDVATGAASHVALGNGAIWLDAQTLLVDVA